MEASCPSSIESRLLTAFPELRDQFTDVKSVAKGAFSVVLHCKCKLNDTHYAIKAITALSDPKLVARELRCLELFNGKHNVIKMLSMGRNRDQYYILMEYCSFDTFSDICYKLTISEIHDYAKNLFEALAYIHSRRIVHRDIKPSNFLYNRRQKKYRLIDFGLAEQFSDKSSKDENKSSYVMPRRILSTNRSNLQQSFDKSKIATLSCACSDSVVCISCLKSPEHEAERSGTAGYRAPEVLLGSSIQSMAIDVWSAGVMIMCLLCGCYPLFRPEDDFMAIAEFVSVFGKEKLQNLAMKVHNRCLVFKGRPFEEAEQKYQSLTGTDSAAKMDCLILLLRDSTSKKCDFIVNGVGTSSYLSFVEKFSHVLDVNPETRLSSKDFYLWLKKHSIKS